MSLTPLQAAIVRLLVEGFSNKEIATQLQLSETGVKQHLHRVYQAIGITTRLQLVVRVHAQGGIKICTGVTSVM